MRRSLVLGVNLTSARMLVEWSMQCRFDAVSFNIKVIMHVNANYNCQEHPRIMGAADGWLVMRVIHASIMSSRPGPTAAPVELQAMCVMSALIISGRHCMSRAFRLFYISNECKLSVLIPTAESGISPFTSTVVSSPRPPTSPVVVRFLLPPHSYRASTAEVSRGCL